MVFLPYFALTWAVWNLQRLISREDCCNEVSRGLWIGRRAFPAEIPKDVTLIVDLTAEFPMPRGVELGREYICVPTLDTMIPGPDRLHDLIKRICANMGASYIHCASGHGRSAAVAVGVLICTGEAESVVEAESIVRKARGGIGLSKVQRQAIHKMRDERITEAHLSRQTAVAAEAKLAKIRDTPEEDEAWRHL